MNWQEACKASDNSACYRITAKNRTVLKCQDEIVFFYSDKYQKWVEIIYNGEIFNDWKSGFPKINDMPIKILTYSCPDCGKECECYTQGDEDITMSTQVSCRHCGVIFYIKPVLGKENHEN